MTAEFGRSSGMKSLRWSQLLVASVAVGSALFSAASLACSVANWDNNQDLTNASLVGNTRYVEECGFLPSTTTPGVGQYAQDNIDVPATAYYASFYALTRFASTPTASNTVTLFQALAGATPQLSVIVRGGTNGPEAILSTPAGDSQATPLNQGNNYNGWNHFKVSRTEDGSLASLSVNGGTPVTVSNVGTTGLDASRLGHIASSTPNLSNLAFDQFVSLREDSAETDPLCPGDVTGDQVIAALDAFTVIGEARGGNLVAQGQPDWTGDGFVAPLDAFQILGAARSTGGSSIPCSAVLGP